MRFWLGLFLAGAALNILVGLPGWPRVLSGELSDPDSYMRLERILDGVRAGHLTNYVRRDGAGLGVLVEWSRLMDALLWLCAAPFAVVFGWKAALFWVGVASGPVIVGLLGVSLAFAAEPFAARRFLFLCPVGAVVLPALANYGGPGVVTHHILVVVSIVVVAGCVARADRFDTGWNFVAGAAGGLAVWLTPETMPFVLLCYGFLALRWLERPGGVGVAALGAGFLDVIGFGFAIDPPAGGYGVVETDRLSVVFVGLALAVFCTGILLWRVERFPKIWLKRVLGGLGAVLFLGVWVAVFPKVLLGPYGLMDAEQARAFFGVIGEMQPARPDATSFADLWPGVLGLAVAVGFFVARPNWGWGYGVLGLVLVFVLGVKFLRFAPVSTAVGAVLVVVALQVISVRFLLRPVVAALGRIGLVAGLLLVPFLPAVAREVFVPVTKQAGTGAGDCDLRPFAPMLAPASGRVVLADVNESPELLWRSDVFVVGSLYHHGVGGFMAARAAWRGPAAEGGGEPAAVRAVGARFVLFCSGAGRTDLVGDLPKDTLWDGLLGGRAPVWLRVVAADRASGWTLYSIAGD